MLKRELYNIFERPKYSKYGYLIQFLILLNIVISVLSSFLPVFISFPPIIVKVFKIIEFTTILLFSIELFLRYYSIGIDERYAGFKGRIKFTLTLYTIIDLLSILPYFFTFMKLNTSVFRIIRLISFVRIFKLIRFQRFFKKLINIYSFASLNIFAQSMVLLVVSIIVIYIFSFILGSIHKSVLIFLDPTEIANLGKTREVIIGIIELFVGLLIGGALISIITSYLIEIINSVNQGYLLYKGSNHIIILNYSPKVEYMLDEIDKYYSELGNEKDILVAVEEDLVREVKKNLKKYHSLEIFVLTGNLLNWVTYERMNINKAEKIVLLLTEDKKILNQNRKISQFIVSNKNFQNSNLQFVIETDNPFYSKDIYQYIFRDLTKNYILINKKEFITKILNRSVVDYNYFKLLSELSSFEGYEFYVLDFMLVFDEPLTFETAYISITDGILIGIVRNEKVILNPDKNLEIYEKDKLLLILENKTSFQIEKDYKIPLPSEKVNIKKPNLKQNRKIIIVGNEILMSKNDIGEFLTEESYNNLKIVLPEAEQYLQKQFWEELKKDNYDSIILNFDDESQFIITLYLRSIYKNENEFLSKIVNIVNKPILSELLSEPNNIDKIILSEKIIGEFIVQILFNRYTYDIFYEITNSWGNEFYILNISEEHYSFLFQCNYWELKSILLKNKMIYIGGFIDNKFIFNCKDIKKLNRIVVLTEGV